MIDIYEKNTPTFKFTFKNADGTPVDLTGKAVKFAGAPKRDATANTWSKDCTLDDPVNGICSAALDATDTATPDVYNAELYITWETVDVPPVPKALTVPLSEDVRIKPTMSV